MTPENQSNILFELDIIQGLINEASIPDPVGDRDYETLEAIEGCLKRIRVALAADDRALRDADTPVVIDHVLSWGDRGGGHYWQAKCCGHSTIGNGGPYNTAEEAKQAARALCDKHAATIAQCRKAG